MAALDSDSDEDLVSYGTGLEPLEEGERPKKPIPLQDQTVRDEKGRYKRFHGAFSGGFSAGYFNTVGSKEGWTPSSFVSSRQNRADKSVLGPEDFMDEELKYLPAVHYPLEALKDLRYWMGMTDRQFGIENCC
uniref:G patch domain-containing protein n=1 Tax=Ursus americanus TaxID=9643 RepID=A0A452RKX2_URSAM